MNLKSAYDVMFNGMPKEQMIGSTKDITRTVFAGNANEALEEVRKDYRVKALISIRAKVAV